MIRKKKIFIKDFFLPEETSKTKTKALPAIKNFIPAILNF